ncbi:MAG: energy-coupling factor ABC transporter permease [Pseudomonadota bacterium]
MDIPAGLLPGSYLLSAAAIYVLFLLLALVTAPWSKIIDNEASHVYFGAVFALTMLWLLRGGIQPGLDYHLLGVTLLCLLFEWQFALFAATIVLLATTWQGPAGWEAFGVNALVMGVVPILFTRATLYVCQRRLPHNFFIYIFVNAFLAGAFSILMAGLASAFIQQQAGVHPADTIGSNFLLILPMLMFGEGFLNGAVITLAVAYKPQWVATFHDRWYLQGR